MRIKLPFIFSQWDSRWANSLLGFNTNSVYNFYNYACLITCLAMTAKYYGKDENPQTINDKLKTVNGFVAGGGDYIYGSLPKIFTDIKEKVVRTPTALTDGQMDEIKTAIDAGYPVMVQLDYNPRTVGLDSHFVLLVDYDPADENNFTIADPLGGKIQSIKAYLGWFRPSFRSTIEKYIIYTGKVPAVTEDMISILKEHYDLYVRNHDKWHEIVHYLLPENDPNATSFDNCKSVIAGLRSRATDLNNQLTNANKELADIKAKLGIKEGEVSELKDKLLKIDTQLKDLEDTAKEAIEDYFFQISESTIVDGYVYLIEANGLYKIGKSVTPEQRIAALQTGSPYPMTTIDITKVGDMAWAERKLQQYFWEKKVRGEWFALSQDDIAIYKEQIKLYTNKTVQPSLSLKQKLNKLQIEIDEAYKTIGGLKNQIAGLESGQEDMGLIKKFVALLKKLFNNGQ